MFNRKLLGLVLSSAFLILSTACTTPLLFVASSRPFHARAYKVLGETRSESCMVSILGIPISTNASLYTTINNAKQSIGADALVEITVDQRNLLTGFYNQTCTIVHAKGIKFVDEQAPFVTPGPAIPVLPKSINSKLPPTDTKAAATRSENSATKPATAVNHHPKTANSKPKKLTRAEKRRLARQEARKKREEAMLKKKQEAERKAQEAKRKAEEIKKKAQEEKLKAQKEKKMAEKQKKEQEEAKQKAQESKPVPQEYAIFCGYKSGQPILVETKSKKIEAEFVKCVHFGVRVKQASGHSSVIPFEKIWSVHMRAAQNTAPATPAKPAIPRQ